MPSGTAERMAPSSARPVSRQTARPAAISWLWLRATATGPSAVTSKVTTATCGGRMARPRRRVGEFLAAGKAGVERHDAVRQLAPETADVADGEELDRGFDRHVGGAGVADARGGDDRLGADLAERGDDLLLAPEQRQRDGDHAGAQHAEQRDDAFHRVAELDRDHGVGGQAEAAQLGGDRGDRPVGVAIGQPARRAVGDAATVGRIGHRQAVRVAHAGAPEQAVEGRAVMHHGRGAAVFVVAQDHVASPCHQVSAR